MGPLGWFGSRSQTVSVPAVPQIRWASLRMLPSVTEVQVYPLPTGSVGSAVGGGPTPGLQEGVMGSKGLACRVQWVLSVLCLENILVKGHQIFFSFVDLFESVAKHGPLEIGIKVGC